MIVEHGMSPLASMAARDFSEIKQNRPPNREVRGPILAKRGSYFLISKGRAKTKFTSIFINKNFKYLKLNSFIPNSKAPIRSNKFKFLNPVFFKARSSPSGKKKFCTKRAPQTQRLLSPRPISLPLAGCARSLSPRFSPAWKAIRHRATEWMQ